jgi:septum formation protein
MSKRLILASASPRRRELLALLGLPFEVIPSTADEDIMADLPPHILVQKLAGEKAWEVTRRWETPSGLTHLGYNGSTPLVLGCDTIVVSDRPGVPAILGKPRDVEDAHRMLRLLSGTTHTVYTGLCLIDAVLEWETDPGYGSLGREVGRTYVETQVQFRELTPAMIDAYIATGDPFDKAGAYGIQGHASAFVEAVYGDYFNVVGLPVHMVGRMLEKVGIEWWRGEEALA